MRVASLLPSATEIVCAIGARDDLVGVSHECDHPAGVADLPVLTRARSMTSQLSREIDRSVRDVVRNALAVYDIDVELLRQVDPDVVLTQDLCDVCAVSFDDVKSAVASLTRDDVVICNLAPTRLADIFDDMKRAGSVLGREARAQEVVAELLERVEAVRRTAGEISERPAVLTIEWIEPVMRGGTWMPELIEIAGGRPLITRPGDKAPALSREQLEAVDPGVLLIKPCGFDLDRTLAELDALPRVLPWNSWRAVREGRVFIADGNAYVNRPGPRIVDSLEILAACVHPDLFPAAVRRFGADVRRLGPGLEVHSFGT